jgi:hypothetical protein
MPAPQPKLDSMPGRNSALASRSPVALGIFSWRPLPQPLCNELAPARQLGLEWECGMRGGCRRQHKGAVTGLRKLYRELAGRLAIKAERVQGWAQNAEAGEIVGGGVSDTRIQTAGWS